MLVEELLKGQIVETLVQQALNKLNEQEQDEADAVQNALTIIENVNCLKHSYSPNTNQMFRFWTSIRRQTRSVFLKDCLIGL